MTREEDAADVLNGALRMCRTRLHEAATQALDRIVPQWTPEAEQARDELTDLAMVRLWGRRPEDPTTFDSFELLALVERHMGTTDSPCPTCGHTATWIDTHGLAHCARCDARHTHAEYC